MRSARLDHIPGIGVDSLGDRADALADPELLRLENLDTDLRPPARSVAITQDQVTQDSANSYLPFQGSRTLRAAAARHVSRQVGTDYDPERESLVCAGGLNGILNVLLACVDPGQEVVVVDPIYAGLINRIRIAGGIPRFVSMTPSPRGWSIDPAAIADAIGPRTAAVLMMSPSMPSGAVLGADHWVAIGEAMQKTSAVLVYDGAMERIRFDGIRPIHPAATPALRDRTVTVGSASKELRMIGWRIGWVVGPSHIISDVNLVGLSNVVCQVGIAQEAVAAALSAEDADRDVAEASQVWGERAHLIVQELQGLPVVPPDGGWSLLIDVAELGMGSAEASERLFAAGRIAATPMVGWGPSGDRYVRFVYANEPVERLRGLRARVESAWAS